MRLSIHAKSGNTFPSGGTWTLSSDLVITGGGVSIIPGSSNDTVFSTKSLQSTAPLGDELVTNNSFDSDLSNWTIGGTGTGWSWDASGAALHTAGNTDTLYQDISIINGETYQVEVTTSGRTAGNVAVDVNGVYVYNYGSFTTFSGNATFQRSLVANATGSYALTITPSSDFDGMITLITVKQITDEAQPNYVLLDDSGDTAFEARVDYGLGNLCLGLGSGRHITTGHDNTFTGFYAGYNNTTGFSNTFTGRNAGYNNTTGHYNTFTGFYAGFSNTTGYNNIFTGLQAGYSNTTGYNNTFTGRAAGFSNTTGYNNTYTGIYAGYNNTTGHDNTFTGFYAGRNNTTGYFNIFTGPSAGYYNTTGYSNTFTGPSAGYHNTTGNNNTFTGFYAGYSNTTGYYNTFTGPSAGYYNTTGHHNTFTGLNAGYSNTTGYYNTFTGFYAGRYLADGTTPNQTSNTSVYLGAETKALADGDTNEIVIGYNAVGIGSNSVVLGNDSIATTALKGNVGFNTTTFGTGLAKGIAIGLGSEPTGTVADTVQMAVQDYAAGDARLYVYGEASLDPVVIGNGEIVIYDGGLKRMTLGPTGFASTSSNGGRVAYSVVAGNPVFTFPSDLDTGIGHAGADQLSLIAGGVEAARVDTDVTAGNTRLLIYDVDTGLLQRVSVGAADSGGTGYKVLRIPN